MICIGIDPGKDGALVALDDATGSIAFGDINGSMDDAIQFLKDVLQQGPIAGVVIEKVGSMPKQGISSTFHFGVTYGHLRGACIALGIPIIAEPTPPVWKKAVFGASIKGLERAEQKSAARDKARELYPQSASWLKRVKDADRAEALLMAHYGLMRWGRS